MNAAKYVSIMIFTSFFVAYETTKSSNWLNVYIIYGVFNSIFAPSVNNKNKGPIPAASIATNKTAKELKKTELI